MARKIHFCLTPQSKPERLAAQREVVQKSKPWEKSTGPVTDAGKKRSSQNGRVHGLYSEEHKQLKKALHSTEKSMRALEAALDTEDGTVDESR